MTSWTVDLVSRHTFESFQPRTVSLPILVLFGEVVVLGMIKLSQKIRVCGSHLILKVGGGSTKDYPFKVWFHFARWFCCGRSTCISQSEITAIILDSRKHWKIHF